DCKYCAQSSHYDTGLGAGKLMDVDAVKGAAETAKAAGATRFCMGAAWRELRDRDVEKVATLVKEVRGLGLETCMTLGMLTDAQAKALKDAGLDYYNHNVDTSPEYYDEVITTRSYEERLETLKSVRDAGIKVCSGGIIGMGEKETDRAGMLETLATMDPHPESVPINMLVAISGTPLDHVKPLEALDWVRTIAVARILMPKSYVRLSAGREELSDEAQAMCFFAGANSIFYGERLLTTGNPDVLNDQVLFDKLGLTAEPGTVRAN
ncbi:MAG: biotin synthase BioB, partial [Rhodospirillales bacterium]